MAPSRGERCHGDASIRLARLLPRRKFSAYKNETGRVGVVAGSQGFVGAALMTAQGALRGGAGLVELFVPKEIYPIVAAAAPAEAMVKADSCLSRLTGRKDRCLGARPRPGQVGGKARS